MITTTIVPQPSPLGFPERQRIAELELKIGAIAAELDRRRTPPSTERPVKKFGKKGVKFEPAPRCTGGLIDQTVGGPTPTHLLEAALAAAQRELEVAHEMQARADEFAIRQEALAREVAEFEADELATRERRFEQWQKARAARAEGVSSRGRRNGR